jgi:hypothetical protein
MKNLRRPRRSTGLADAEGRGASSAKHVATKLLNRDHISCPKPKQPSARRRSPGGGGLGSPSIRSTGRASVQPAHAEWTNCPVCTDRPEPQIGRKGEASGAGEPVLSEKKPAPSLPTRPASRAQRRGRSPHHHPPHRLPMEWERPLLPCGGKLELYRPVSEHVSDVGVDGFGRVAQLGFGLEVRGLEGRSSLGRLRHLRA